MHIVGGEGARGSQVNGESVGAQCCKAADGGGMALGGEEGELWGDEEGRGRGEDTRKGEEGETGLQSVRHGQVRRVLVVSHGGWIKEVFVCCVRVV